MCLVKTSCDLAWSLTVTGSQAYGGPYRTYVFLIVIFLMQSVLKKNILKKPKQYDFILLN
jgi:hypothetical protein